MHGYSCKRSPVHLALYTCMDGCTHPDLWSRSNKSLLSVANNLMCMYQNIFCLITQWMIYAAWFLIHPCTLLSSRDLCDLEIQELEAVATWAHQGHYRSWGFSKLYISRWMKCLIYLEYGNNTRWQGHILRYLSWFIDDFLPIFVAELLWIVKKMHVNNRLLSTAAHCCCTMAWGCGAHSA